MRDASAGYRTPLGPKSQEQKDRSIYGTLLGRMVGTKKGEIGWDTCDTSLHCSRLN